MDSATQDAHKMWPWKNITIVHLVEALFSFLYFYQYIFIALQFFSRISWLSDMPTDVLSHTYNSLSKSVIIISTAVHFSEIFTFELSKVHT